MFPQYKLVLSYRATSNEHPRKQLLNQNIFLQEQYKHSQKKKQKKKKKKGSCFKPKQVCCINEATYTQMQRKKKKRHVHWPLQAGKFETCRLRGTVDGFRLL